MTNTKAQIDKLAQLAADDAVRRVVTTKQEQGIGLFLNDKSTFFLPTSLLSGFPINMGTDEIANHIMLELKKIVANAVGQGIVNFYRCQVDEMLQDYCKCLNEGFAAPETENQEQQQKVNS